MNKNVNEIHANYNNHGMYDKLVLTLIQIINYKIQFCHFSIQISYQQITDF